VFVVLMTRTLMPTWNAPVFVIPENVCEPVAKLAVDVDVVDP
jgi:hypothetical protein